MDYKRFIAFERSIKEINPENDGRVRILGTIISKDKNFFMFDDGSENVKVFFENMDSLKENALVRVIGRVLPTQENFDIQGEIIQNMDGFDVESYKKVQKEWRNVNV